MALRNQPYLPLYVNDYMGDEKLRECSAEAWGVYSFLLCLMHKCEKYGVFVLREDDITDEDIIKCFTHKLKNHMPWECEIIEKSIRELIKKNVINLQKNTLFQKRMVRDGKLSEIRAKAGKKGGISAKTSYGKSTSKTEAKEGANTEIENSYINTINNNINKGGVGGKKKFTPPSLDDVKAYCNERKNNVNPKRFWEYFDTGGWIDSEGKPVQNWKQKLITWENKEKENGAYQQRDKHGDVQRPEDDSNARWGITTEQY